MKLASGKMQLELAHNCTCSLHIAAVSQILINRRTTRLIETVVKSSQYCRPGLEHWKRCRDGRVR